MKILDKLKNALFEEEHVEIEEKPKKKPIKKEKKVDRIKEVSKEIEEKPIAKKIVLPEREEKEEVKITTSDDFIEEEVKEPKKEKSFPIISDNEFLTEPIEEEKEKPKKEYKDIFEKNYEKPKVEDNYQHKRQEQHPKLYGMDDMPIPSPEYGTYEKEDRTYFKPSPIISPIYGILDKNYRKEEIIPKREVRLTSAYSRESLDVDAVRKKAYGTLTDSIEDRNEEVEESNFTDQDLVDLSSVNETPEVKKVTIADAEEYFNDLGLEYNVDYKDGQKEKATGRRYNEEKEEDFAPVVDKEEFEARQNTDSITEDDSIGDDDNLFDLIDSMYEKE